jgi:hypothetical protein
MKLRRRAFPVLSVCLFGVMMCPANLPAQAVVLTTRSATDLAEDVETLIKSAELENEQIGQMVLGGLNQLKIGAILKGLDRGRGLGVAISLPKNFPDGGPPTAVLALPVSDLGVFLESLKDLGLTVDDQAGAPGFSHKVVGPNGNPTLFVLQSKGYALCSPIPVGAENLRAIDPSSWRPKGRPERALSLVVRLAELPEQVKKRLLDSVEAQAANDRKRRPEETEAAFRGRMAGQELVYAFFNSIVRQGKEIALELDVDRNASQLTIDATISAMPNTALEKSLRGLNGRRSQFQGLAQESVAAAWGNFSIPNELRDVLMLGFDEQIKASSDRAPKADEKKLFRRTTELARAVFNQPALDFGVAVRQIKGAGASGTRAVLLIGWNVPNGKDFDRHFRDTSVVAKLTDKLKLTYDVAKGADGTSIHQISGSFDENDAELVKRFGKASLFLSARADAILLSFGEDGLPALQGVLAKMSEPPGEASVAPIAAVARLGGTAVLVDPQRAEVRRIISQVYPDQAEKRDRITLDLKGQGDANVLHLAIDLQALGLLRQIMPLMQK